MEQTATRDNYTTDEVDTKKDGGEEEPTESAPLNKGDEVVDGVGTKDNDTCLTPAIKDNKRAGGGGVRGWFAKEKIKWCIAIIVAVVLLAVVLVATLLALGDSIYQDNTPRLMILWPRPNRPNNLIYFQAGNEEGTEWDKLVTQLNRLTSNYEAIKSRDDQLNVTECFGSPPPEGTSCFFDIKLVSPECSQGWHYGYNTGTPCVFLQFSNITDWKPEHYVTRDLESPHLDLPTNLRSSYRPNVVYLDCEGVTTVDRENMGEVEYTPEQGFKYNFFPYVGLPDYMPPLVALHFKSPATGVAIGITCKLWAKNINHTVESLPSGSLHFSLLID